MNRIQCRTCLKLTLIALAVVRADAESLRMSDAVNLALERNADIALSALDQRVADAARMGAAARLNPELRISAEDIAGSGTYDGTDSAQYTAEIAQTVELGGKRRARIRAADDASGMARLDYADKKLAVAVSCAQAFVDVLAAQERLAQSQDFLALAQSLEPAAKRRIDAGRGSPAEAMRAAAAATSAELSVHRRETELDVARRRLAAVWGDTDPAFENVIGELDRLPNLPSMSDALAEAERHPRLARSAAARARQEAELALQQANRRGDLTISAGVRQFNDTDDSAAIVALSHPLPIFKRGRGEVAAAQVELEKAESSASVQRAHHLTELNITVKEAEQAREEVQRLKADVLPQLKEAGRLAQEGYESGHFSYLEVFDAREILLETEEQLINARAKYHKSAAAILGLMGRMPGGDETTKE